MIDSADKKTIHLIPELKKRGRPSTGTALTPAERKARQRDRDTRKTINAVASGGFNAISTTGLLEQLSSAISLKNYDLAKVLASHLVKRAK